jgi:endoglucanase
MFQENRDGVFLEDDFRTIAGWGFDFVRLPMCYRLWTAPGDPFSLREEGLAKVDRAVDMGRRWGVHVCLNFHHAPGYCINRRVSEPVSLWKDGRALDAFAFHWEAFARRYRGVPSSQVSFNLVNEPPAVSEAVMTRADHERVVRRTVAAIRSVDAERLIVIDGLSAGREPARELADLGVAQSCRAYEPMGLSHYMASWVNGDRWPLPVWPGAPGWHGEPWDRARLEESYRPWAELARSGVGVHCGEGGSHSRTPHDVFLRWFRDVMDILKRHNIGWALWNLRGGFGVLDSGREDVRYEDFRGHALDAELLALLQES